MSASIEIQRETEQIREAFLADPRAVRPETALCKLADRTVRARWQALPPTPGFAAMAVGGYGRGKLHPASDLDILILFRDTVDEDRVKALLSPLWDLDYRIGHQIRELSDFGEFSPADIDSYTAFMDARFLYGDAELAAEMITEVLPASISRDREAVLSALMTMKRERYAKFGGTVFQLEPDIKSAPGALRDIHWIRWMDRVRESDPSAGGSRPGTLLDEEEWLERIRSLLHFMSGRDQNILTYEYQERTADALGYTDSDRGRAAENFMHDYFMCAEEVAGRAEEIESRAAGVEDAVPLDRVPRDAEGLIDCFRQSHRTKRWFTPGDLARLRDQVGSLSDKSLAEGENPRAVLEMMKDRRGIYRTLSAMHRVGLLGRIFPEFERIRCRVIRDYFHKYTVDEHSLMAIRNIESLDHTTDAPNAIRGLRSLLDELVHPELLLLSILLHDIGKSASHPEGDHACSSVEDLEPVLGRLRLPEEQQARVRNVVRNHLEMSKVVMRRDLSDPVVIRDFAGLVGTIEDLKMLCLLTYADMRAVSPEVWTSWKGDLLWQLYVSTHSHLRHGYAEDRYAQEENGTIATGAIAPYVPPSTGLVGLNAFLDGLPRQFLNNTPPDRIGRYFQRYVEFSNGPSVVTDWFPNGDLWDVLVIVRDRPLLFATIAGALSAIGMNTVRAQACSNREGVVIDMFTVEDVSGSLATDLSERSRLDQVLKDAVNGKVGIEKLLERRATSVIYRRVAADVPLKVFFERSGTRSIMEVVSADEPGLLFRIARAVAALDCDIEAAIVSTEGVRALDVFYLTHDGGGLSPQVEEAIRERLSQDLRPSTT